MKIRSLLFYGIIIISLSGVTGCKIFKGGGDCDCPKFGQIQQSESEQEFASNAT